ncbi:vesicle coat component [Dispira simplex]|nr:vesicle coat component [Dispira simplex]
MRLANGLWWGALLGCGLVSAIKFDLTAFPEGVKEEKCLSQWAPKDTHVLVKAKVGPGAGQRVEMRVYDLSPSSNVYASRHNVDNVVTEFTTHEHSDVVVCFRNILEGNMGADGRSRPVTFSMDVGASSVDYRTVMANEKLKPLEAELAKLEKYLEEVDDQLNYMRRRERKLRNTNESTNERVKFLGVLSLLVLVGSGLWQIFYLRRFFQQKKLM